jgi:hypothetical protein
LGPAGIAPATRGGGAQQPLVVLPPLAGVREDLVGVLDLLEALLGGVVARVGVWVVLAYQSAVGAADVLLGSFFRQPEQPVQIFGRPHL